MNIVLYSNDCPKCKILEKKLNEKGIKYEICRDVGLMPNKIIEANTVPWLKVNDELLNFGQAVKYINQIRG